MKKYLFMVLSLLLLTGCGLKKKTDMEVKKENIIGKWTTSYQLGSLGQIKESYTFKKDGKCVRTLNAGSDIVDECTYEITDQGIRIVWESKIDKESYSKYVEIDENSILIGEHTYQKEND